MLLFQSRIKVFFSCRRNIRWRTDNVIIFTCSFAQQHQCSMDRLFWFQQLNCPLCVRITEPGQERTSLELRWPWSMLSTIKVHTHHSQLLPHSLTETVIESLRLLFFLWVCSHIAVYAVGWKELLCKGKALGLLHLHYLPLYLWKWCLWKHKCFGLNILLQCSKNIWS